MIFFNSLGYNKEPRMILWVIGIWVHDGPQRFMLILQFYAKQYYGLTYHRHNRGEKNTKHTQGGNTDPGGQAVGHITGQY